MAHATQVTTKTRLKTIPALDDIQQADFAQARKAKQKADLIWQMNLAKIKLSTLKDEDIAARGSLSGFHDAARKSLWHAQRAS